MQSAKTRGTVELIVMLAGGIIVLGAILLGPDPAASVETRSGVPAVSEGPPTFMGALGELGRSRGIDLPQ